jgi:hypothetical protein
VHTEEVGKRLSNCETKFNPLEADVVQIKTAFELFKRQITSTVFRLSLDSRIVSNSSGRNGLSFDGVAAAVTVMQTLSHSFMTQTAIFSAVSHQWSGNLAVGSTNATIPSQLSFSH